MAPQPHPPPDSSGNGHSPGLGGRVGSLGRAAHSLTEELRHTAADFGRALDLRGRAQRHPYALMAAALGVGYVLGGGLFSRTTARALALAGRVAALSPLRGELWGLAEAVLSGAAEGPEGGRPSGSDVPSPS